MLRRVCSVFTIVAIILASNAIADEDQAGNTLALNFAYSPLGSTTDLASGYKKHLDWHIARNDPILWYAWFVVEGDRLGHFIDGAYDVTGAQFDLRPDPAGDAADAAENFSPVVEMQYRRIFRLRRDLGTSSFLEDHHPSALMQVVYYHVNPGRQIEFEMAASAIADSASDAGIDYAIYEMLTGATGALYALYIPLVGFSSFDNAIVSLELAARSAMPERELSAALADLALATISTNSEVWSYRSDLSLIPGQHSTSK